MSTSKTFENGYILVINDDGSCALSHEDFPENRSPLPGLSAEDAAPSVEKLPHPQAEEARNAWSLYQGATSPVKTPRQLAQRMRAGMSPPNGTPVWMQRAARRQLARR